MKKIESLLQKTRKVRVFGWKGIRKNTPLLSKIHCYVQNTNGLDLVSTGTEVIVTGCGFYLKGDSNISS